MPSRIMIRGRTVWHSRDWKPIDWSKGLARNSKGEPVDAASAIASDDPQSPFRTGLPYKDPQEGIVYLIVASTKPQDGWGTTDFWQDRWNVPHRSVVRFVELGFLDAAIEEGSRIKRYRCRDEAAIKNSADYRAAKRQGANKRYNDKRLRTIS